MEDVENENTIYQFLGCRKSSVRTGNIIVNTYICKEKSQTNKIKTPLGIQKIRANLSQSQWKGGSNKIWAETNEIQTVKMEPTKAKTESLKRSTKLITLPLDWQRKKERCTLVRNESKDISAEDSRRINKQGNTNQLDDPDGRNQCPDTQMPKLTRKETIWKDLYPVKKKKKKVYQYSKTSSREKPKTRWLH